MEVLVLCAAERLARPANALFRIASGSGKASGDGQVASRSGFADTPVLQRIVRGVPVTIHLGSVAQGNSTTSRSDDEHLHWLQSTLDRFRPDLLVLDSADQAIVSALAPVRARGTRTIFAPGDLQHGSGTLADFDAVIVSSQFAADYYERCFGRTCAVLPLLVDADRVRACRRDPSYVTFVASGDAQSVLVFARIADELGRRRPDIPLLVFEGASARPILEACGPDLNANRKLNVLEWPGSTSEIWRQARVCVMPAAAEETSPGVAVEALLNGIPVIGSDRGAIPETLRSAGLVLPLPERLSTSTRELPTPEEVSPWVEAIIRLWDDPAVHEEQSRRAQFEGRRWDPRQVRPVHVRFFAGLAAPARSPHDLAPLQETSVRRNSPLPPELAEPMVKTTIRAGLSAIRKRWPKLRNECVDDPIFILAAGWRSGSTLLQRLVVQSCFLWGEPFGHAWMIDLMADPIRCFNHFWPEAHHFHRGQDAQTLSRQFIANLYPPVQDLLRAHQAYFDRLFAEPARRAGAKRWGVKEVRLSVDHAAYLQWLFPRAKFLFLIRNPYDAWRSYAAWAERGWLWYNRWPDEPVTVKSFVALWRDLVTSFLDDHAQVGGQIVWYERLARGEYDDVEQYLGFPLSREAGQVKPNDGGPPPVAKISPADREVLEQGLGALAGTLGYALRPDVHPRGTIGGIGRQG